VKINDEMHYLWRAADREGEMLESFVTKNRDKAAALNFLKRVMKRYGKPEVIVTDGLLPRCGEADSGWGFPRR
jgi:putative transposase